MTVGVVFVLDQEMVLAQDAKLIAQIKHIILYTVRLNAQTFVLMDNMQMTHLLNVYYAM